MDYHQQCQAMMKHLGENYTPERFATLIQALGSSIARTMTLIRDHGEMHAALQRVCDTMHVQACGEHNALHPAQPIDHVTFLRDVFKPEKTND